MNTSSKSLVTGLRRLQLSSELIPQPCFQGFSATKTPGNEVVFTLSTCLKIVVFFTPRHEFSPYPPVISPRKQRLI